MSLMTRTFTPRQSDPQPPCPACSIALEPRGSGRNRYWSCQDCGVAMRRH